MARHKAADTITNPAIMLQNAAPYQNDASNPRLMRSQIRKTAERLKSQIAFRSESGFRRDPQREQFHRRAAAVLQARGPRGRRGDRGMVPLKDRGRRARRMSVLPNVPCRGHHRHYNRRLWRARTGGTCDACDKAVAPTQLVMAVPGGGPSPTERLSAPHAARCVA